MIKALIAQAHSHPKITAWVGVAMGWLSVDWLRTAQIFAASMAGLASFCAVVLTAPKAWAEVKRWFRKNEA